MTNQATNRPVLTMDQIRNYAPAVFATEPHDRVSSRYSFIPTSDVLELMMGQGWQPVKASAVRTKRGHIDRAGFQKHLIRFQHPDMILGDEVIDCIVVNSHDLGSAYQFMLGVYRMVCSNGMMTGNTVQERVTKGSYRKYLHAGNTRGKKAKAIKSINSDLAFNRALFNLTEEMEKLAKRAA